MEGRFNLGLYIHICLDFPLFDKRKSHEDDMNLFWGLAEPLNRSVAVNSSDASGTIQLI